VHIPLGEGASVLSMHARTIAPDGTVREVKPDEVFEDHAKVSSEQGSVHAKQKVFRLPGVQVGTILEYEYEVENLQLAFWGATQISGPLPIERYSVALHATPNITWQVHTYHTAEKFHGAAGRDQNTVVFETHDVPAYRDEFLDPPWQKCEPWWAFHVNAVDYHGTTYPMYGSWANVLEGVTESLYTKLPKKLGAGAKLAVPDAVQCNGDRRCIVEHALAWLREKAPLDRFETRLDTARPFKDVLTGGSATNFEKALLFHALLKQAGVASRFVLLARNPGLDADPEFALPGRFDHLLVDLPLQQGIAATTLVDPSCEYCAFGELPMWSEGRQIIVVHEPIEGVTTSTKRLQLGTVESNKSRIGEEHRQVAITVAPTGAVRGKMKVKGVAQRAVDSAIAARHYTAERWRTEEEDALHARDKTARLEDSAPQLCDRADGHCEVEYAFSIAQYAAVEDNGLVMPLSLLLSSWDKPPTDGKRTHDIYASRSSAETEELVVTLPPGYVPIDLPAPAKWHAPGFDATFSIERVRDTLVVRRTVDVHRGHWSVQEYAALDTALRDYRDVRRKSITIRKQ
jgi:hypothetical protein